MNHCKTCAYWHTDVPQTRAGIKIGVCGFDHYKKQIIDVRRFFLDGEEDRVIVGEGNKLIYTAENFGCSKHREK